MDIPSFLRPLGLAAGPLAVVALGLEVTALATAGAGVESSPLAIAASALLLVALLGIGAAALAALVRLRETGRTAGAPVLALVGTVLVAGGTWAALFVLPSLASEAPEVLESGALGSVMVGYIASYVVFALGWLTTGAALLRAGIVPTWLGVLVAVSGVLSMVPSPETFRLLVVSIAATLVARRLAARAAEPARVTAAA